MANDGGRGANELAGESSPYLLQHAHNPVRWRPWGEAAIAEARRRGAPILLSVGYSTCYWCHVMERECFENEEIAAVMNAHFVCVKLDREERPDIDDVYMNALLVTRGQGGWPMNVFLEPEQLRPIWCGTYFPPEPRGGLPSWTEVLEGVAGAWRDKRPEVIEQSARIAEAVKENLSVLRPPAGVGAEQISAALQQLLGTFDRVNGGFGGPNAAPKFPQPLYLEFLLDVRGAAGDDQTGDAIELCLKRSLDGMLCGGIYDQLGGGFHRYSVDATWTVPHFEKMLYDNAQLAGVYARASAQFGDEEYERIARGVLDYVLREMTGPEGGFFSAQDAEVDGREGLNYVWTAEQLREALEADDADLAGRVYGFAAGPNFRDPHHPHEAPVNVPRLADRLDRLAPKLNHGVAELRERLEGINRRLLAARSGRKQPGLDDKVLASWNGLMISGMARGYAALGERRYLEAAQRAAGFVLRRMLDASGRLVRSWRGGKAGSPGFLEDSALMIRGLVDLAEALGAAAGAGSGDGSPRAMAPRYMLAAETLARGAIADFKERTPRGIRYCDTRVGRSDLFVRTSSMHDGVMAGGPSGMLDALIALAAATGKDEWKREAGELLASLSGEIAAAPVGCINATRGLARVMLDKRLSGVLEMNTGAPGTAAQGAEIAGATGASAGIADGVLPVEVYAAVDRVRVSDDEPAEFTLVLKIADGYHITAADPGPGGEGLVPLRVGIVHGSGVVAYADYPEGELYQAGLRVHSGTVEMTVVLESVGPWKGRPLVAITYQACTQTACLLPVTVELDVAVEKG